MTPFQILRNSIERDRMQNSYTKEQIIELIDLIYLDLEKKESLKHQLFIGKVVDIIGVDKTLKLLKEVNEEIR